LHSVLVHAGDVGGGHYYAYIRPSTDINCQYGYQNHTVSVTLCYTICLLLYLMLFICSENDDIKRNRTRMV